MPLLIRILFVSLCCLCCVCGPALSEEIDRASFAQYLDRVQQQAISQGISERTVSTAFEGLLPDPRVITFDRRQPEFVQTFEQYLNARVSTARVAEAREQFVANRSMLRKIAADYGVDQEYLVAFWGLESSFGRYQGKYDIIRSLATLGHDPRRTTFFTRELLAALRILDEGHVPRAQFMGGWAGAMGQNQFLPSTFLNYAVDYDGDGRKNIFSDRQDVWASIANYLARHGWIQGAGWGTAVSVPGGLDLDALAPESIPTGCRALRGHTRKMVPSEWRERGIDVAAGILDEDAPWALIRPDENETKSYLVGGNFRAILSYNCANKYAVSVGLLADLIREGD